MDVKKKKHTLGLSFRFKMYLLTIFPALIVTTLITIVGINQLNINMNSLSEKRMSNVTNTLAEFYNVFFKGDWSYENGVLMKGDNDLSNSQELLDNIYNQNGIHSTIFYGDTRIITTIKDENGNNIIGTKASQEVIDKVLKKGEHFFNENVVINGEKYYSFYEPLKDSNNNVIGMIFMGVICRTIKDNIFKAISNVFIMFAVLTIIDLTITLLFTSSILKNLKNSINSLITLDSGDLNIEVKVSKINSKDELGLLANIITNLAQKLKEITGNVKNSANILNSNVKTLNQVAGDTNNAIIDAKKIIQDISKGAMSQAEDTQDAAIKIGEMSTSIDLVVDKVGNLTNLANNTQDASSKAKDTMKELISINTQTKNSVDKIVDQSKTNVEATAKINDIVKVISDIAEQTNLLSLNANIEAARAGEQGKGFAVVADEVGKLAQSSSNAAKEIEKIIQDLALKISETSKLTEILNNNTNQQILKLKDTSKNFNNLILDINSIFDETVSINQEVLKVNEIKVGISNIIKNLSTISEENVKSTEETTTSTNVVATLMEDLNKSAKTINSLSTELLNIIAYFK